MITATDAGGPLDVVHDGSTGRVVDPDAAAVAAAAVWLRDHPDAGGGVRAGGQGDRPGGHLGHLDRAAALVKVAIFSPMPPERSGIADYSALLLPALRARCEVVVVKRGAKRPPRGTDLCVYHIGNNPDAHGWIVEALRRTPGVVVLHDFVLHHLVAGLTIGRRDGHGYLDAMEREGGVVGRLLGHAVLDKRIPPLWENRPQDFHLAGEVLGLATGLIVHSHYVHDRARAAGYAGPIWIVPHPAFPVPDGARGRDRGRSALRHVRQRQLEQAGAAAARGVRARPAGAVRTPACCSSAPPRPASTSTGGCSGSGSTAAASCARASSTRPGCGG